MPKTLPVFVRATFLTSGEPHVVTRTLTADYARRQDCQTALDIDGKPAAEADLARFGIPLSQPPLRAPVLAQHTLGYLFSARPQDRASYFKALLEVTDLEELRATVAAAETALTAPESPLIAALAATGIAAAAAALRPLATGVPAAPAVTMAIDAALGAIITGEDREVPVTTAERIAAVVTLLADKRSRTFPVRGFDKQPLAGRATPAADLFAALATYLVERGKVDAETRRLAALFAEALRLPAVAAAADSLDCPLCGAEVTLTHERIAFIRERLKDAETFRAAERAATEAVGRLHSYAQSILKQMSDALPRFVVYPSKARRERGFRIDRIRGLLGDDKAVEITAWLRTLNRLMSAWGRAARLVRCLEATSERLKENLEDLVEMEPLQSRCDDLAVAAASYVEAHAAYLPAETVVFDSLRHIIDTESQTTGWQELIDIAKNPSGLRAALIDTAACQQLKREMSEALLQIDRGNESVLQTKFEDLSADIATWWDLLRPDELNFFAAVRPRPGARRTIDFKAGFSITEDRSDPQLRDVIAVFSQSQLHCLGLALFIARSVHEKAGFILLDDPILSSDDDYRMHFNSAVLEKLMDMGVQVILLTQDQRTCRDLTERY
jgi:hypothetical protein